MIIKINGIPWENVKVPDINNGYDFFDPQALSETIINEGVVGLFHRFDQDTYFLMSQTEVTEHVYKAACWGVEKAATFIFGGGAL